MVESGVYLPTRISSGWGEGEETSPLRAEHMSDWGRCQIMEFFSTICDNGCAQD